MNMCIKREIMIGLVALISSIAGSSDFTLKKVPQQIITEIGGFLPYLGQRAWRDSHRSIRRIIEDPTKDLIALRYKPTIDALNMTVDEFMDTFRGDEMKRTYWGDLAPNSSLVHGIKSLTGYDGKPYSVAKIQIKNYDWNLRMITRMNADDTKSYIYCCHLHANNGYHFAMFDSRSGDDCAKMFSELFNGETRVSTEACMYYRSPDKNTWLRVQKGVFDHE